MRTRPRGAETAAPPQCSSAQEPSQRANCSRPARGRRRLVAEADHYGKGPHILQLRRVCLASATVQDSNAEAVFLEDALLLHERADLTLKILRG